MSLIPTQALWVLQDGFVTRALRDTAVAGFCAAGAVLTPFRLKRSINVRANSIGVVMLSAIRADGLLISMYVNLLMIMCTMETDLI